MNEKFFTLPEEKQLRIINAAMEIFARYEYKRASTDDIAAKAEISKGLLFYYFHNKKALYLYVYEYTADLMKAQILDENYWNITDFFELLKYCAEFKARILEKNPYIMEFAIRSFYPDNPSISDDLNSCNQNIKDTVFHEYLKNIDFSKFKDKVEPAYIYQMLIWMADGFLHEKRVLGQPISLDEIMDQFEIWMTMFKPMVYKEEYL